MNRRPLIKRGAGLGVPVTPFLLAFLVLAGGNESGEAQLSSTADSLRRIQSVVPLSGPPGTRVEIYTENLPVQARVHVGVGAIGAGFEALAEARQEMWGEVSASIQVPDYTNWEKPIVFIIFNGIFSPIGISDPFHVTNSEGLVRRQGVVTQAGPGCIAMRDADSFVYALTGDVEALSPGDEVVIEGTVSGSRPCAGESTLSVVRVDAAGTSRGRAESAADRRARRNRRLGLVR